MALFFHTCHCPREDFLDHCNWVIQYRFSESPEGLTELRKAAILTVLVYYSKRLQINVNTGKQHLGQRPGERPKLPVALPLLACHIENTEFSQQQLLILFFIFLKDFIYLFLERGAGKEKERERNINVWLPLLHPQLGTRFAT